MLRKVNDFLIMIFLYAMQIPAHLTVLSPVFNNYEFGMRNCDKNYGGQVNAAIP